MYPSLTLCSLFYPADCQQLNFLWCPLGHNKPLRCPLWVHSAIFLLSWKGQGASLSLTSADLVLIWKMNLSKQSASPLRASHFFLCHIFLHRPSATFLPNCICLLVCVISCKGTSSFCPVWCCLMTTFVRIRCLRGCWSGNHTNPKRCQSCGQKLVVQYNNCEMHNCTGGRKKTLLFIENCKTLSLT